MPEEIIEFAGEVIGGVAEAVSEIGAAAASSNRNNGRGCRIFLVFALVLIIVAAVAANFFV
ncbi:hypothetical protein HFO56_33615 [Rhizobium laguerreae]|uniref:hypothetical protein n=1 Tax=Rhizobium laguerreae TaxID=1076926 RepID=UPI001C8FC02C|nr:hypothetical protein [Rhizobium laguerreae]MBY3157265.1 hypothetical protein [Rhizobium laguerreae]